MANTERINIDFLIRIKKAPSEKIIFTQPGTAQKQKNMG